MGIDNDLICMDCKEYIAGVARNGVLCLEGGNGLLRLNAFLQKHADDTFDHHLVFTGDDRWSRRPDGSTEFEYETGSGDRRLTSIIQDTYVVRIMLSGKRVYLQPEPGESWTWEEAQAVLNESALQSLKDLGQFYVARRLTTENGG